MKNFEILIEPKYPQEYTTDLYLSYKYVGICFFYATGLVDYTIIIFSLDVYSVCHKYLNKEEVVWM